MTIADLSEIAGRTYPARRKTQNLVGGASPIQIYFIVEGTGEMCLGDERQTVTTGQAVYIPSQVFHQLTNTSSTPMRMIYCYGPAGDVAHWRQELDGTLPRAGVDVPALPSGAQPQCIGKSTVRA